METDRLNYVFRQGAHEVFEIFASVLDVRSAFFTTKGNPIYSGSKLPMCKYCRMLRKDLGMEEECHNQDLDSIREARKTGSLVTYTCHGGMQEMAMPIHFENTIIGYAIIGQFRNNGQRVSPYASRWENRFGNNRLQEIYESSPMLNQERIEGLKKLFRHSVRSIESDSLIVLKDYDLISPLIEQIHRHPENTLTIEEAEKIIGRSKSTINRLFKNTTGHAFRQYQIQTKIEIAQQIMRNHPQQPAAVVAEQLGFDDPLYFSRLFKKHTGQTPSSFRNAVIS